MSRIRQELAAAKTLNSLGLYRTRRPATLRALGVVLLPTSITTAWYAQECPRHLDVTGLTVRDRLRWRVSCALRGASAR